MKRDRKAQLKELKQQKAAGGQLSNRQQSRLDFLQRRAQDSKPAKQPQQPQPMPDWKPLNEQPGVFKPALDGMAQAAPGMPIRDMAERMGGQELRPDNMEMQQPFPMPRGGMEQPAAQPAAWQPQAAGQQMPDGIANPISRPAAAQAPVYGITNPIGRPAAGGPRPMYGITNPVSRPPGLMGLGQRAANG